MVTALIVVGVIAFLAFDAFILYRVFKARRSADDYGTLSVPGEITLTLPTGKVKLSYQESYKARGDSDHIYFGVPDQLVVSVLSPGGEPLEVKGPGFRGMGSVVETGSNWSRALVGTIEVVEPGDYTVIARAELQ